MSRETASLAELCEIRSGGTPLRSKAEFYGGQIPWAKISDLDVANGIVTRTEETLTDKGLAAIRGRLFKPGTLLFAIYGSIGKMAFAGQPISTNQAILGIEIQDRKRLDDRYLYRWLSSKTDHFLSDGQGIAQKNLSAAYLRDLLISLPPLDEQRRIAAILDKADALRRKRKRVAELIRSVPQSLFMQMFGDPQANPGRWNRTSALSDVADIGSGITKGRKEPSTPVRAVPYLAVANVQDRTLDLSAVKTIEASEEEISRFRLRSGDLVLTEGGDPDKLGRGTVWRDELPEAIHQNHIFRVRIDPDELDPLYLNFLVGSEYGKRYFLRSAKQTTGIASINKSQLSRFPVLLPPLDLQKKFASEIDRLAVAQDRAAQSDRGMLDLFASLQHRAFCGQL